MASQTVDTTTYSIKGLKYRDTHQVYDVFVGTTRIRTLVTRKPEIVDTWVSTMQKHENNIDIIGLDIEWRAKSLSGDHTRPSTLQLCAVERSNTGRKYIKCLVFQVKHCDNVPQSVVNYLGDKSCVFVSERMEYVMEKLNEYYKLDMAYPIDISRFFEVVKPKKPNAVRDSDWDKMYLDPNQVKYACLDAFVSYQEASHYVNTMKGTMQIPHGLSLEGMTQYLFGKKDPEAVLAEKKDQETVLVGKKDEDMALVEEDYDMIVSDEFDDDFDDDYEVILHNEVYDV